VLVPTSEFIQKLTAARLAADVADVPTVIIARTDALGAYLLTSDIDQRDRAFCTGLSCSVPFFVELKCMDLASHRNFMRFSDARRTCSFLFSILTCMKNFFLSDAVA